MAAAKGIKELEDELEELKKEWQGEVIEDDEPAPPKKRIEDNEDTFVTAPSKKEEETPEDEPNKEEESWKKRYGDLRRHSQKQKESLEARITELERSQKSGTTNEPPANPEDVRVWVETYPQVAAIIQTLAEEKAKKLYGEDIQSLKKETEREKKNRELARIYKAHDDFDEIKNDDKFHDWAESQPEFVQDAIYKGSADQVIWAVNQYKTSLEKAPNRDKDAATAIPRGTKSTPTPSDKGRRFLESEVEDMSMDEYVKLQEEIQTAIKEGRFVYDLSGAAR